MVTPTLFLALEILWIGVMLGAIYHLFTLRNKHSESTVAAAPWIALFINASAVLIIAFNPSTTHWSWQPYLLYVQTGACAVQAGYCVWFWHKKRNTRCWLCGRTAVTNDPCLDCSSEVVIEEKASLLVLAEMTPSDLEKA